VVPSLPVTVTSTPPGNSTTGVTGSSFSYTPAIIDTEASIRISGAPGYDDAVFNNIPVTVPPPAMPIELSPNNGVTVGNPVTLQWVDPGAGTSSAADFFGYLFFQGPQLINPTGTGADFTNHLGQTEVGPYQVEPAQGPQIGWKVWGHNSGGDGPTAIGSFTLPTSPYITVRNEGSDVFVVNGTNFTPNGSVSFDVTPVLSVPGSIPKNLNADSNGNWELIVRAAGLCKEVNRGALVFSAMDNATGNSSNNPQGQCQ
jgi:hypothetical protein